MVTSILKIYVKNLQFIMVAKIVNNQVVGGLDSKELSEYGVITLIERRV